MCGSGAIHGERLRPVVQVSSAVPSSRQDQVDVRSSGTWRFPGVGGVAGAVRWAGSWPSGFARRRWGTAGRSVLRLGRCRSSRGRGSPGTELRRWYAVVPPLVEVGLERVEDAGPAGGLDQQLIDTGRIGGLGGGADGDAQPPGDLPYRAAFGAQRLDGRVAFPVAGDKPPLPSAVTCPACRSGSARTSRISVNRERSRLPRPAASPRGRPAPARPSPASPRRPTVRR